ncbi:MAG: hypothetical protein SGILL_007731 [Bacillariaceae sp.]
MSGGKEQAVQPTDSVVVLVVRRFLQFSAFLFALAPSVLKLYETSHWYRGDDPSQYDLAKEWFAVARIPYAKAFLHDDKTLMRVYFFIVPYILSALCLLLNHALRGMGTKARTLSHPPRSYLVLRSLLEQTWTIPKPIQRFLWQPSQVSTAELLGVAAYLVLNIGTFAVRVKRSYPRGTRKLHFLVDLDEDMGKEPIPHVSWEGCEIWAKTLGILAIMNLGWYLILPIGRRSVMLEAFCLSWERAVKYHRWIGYYTFALVIGHGVMYLGVWIYGDGNERYDPDSHMVRRNLVPWACSDDGSGSDSADGSDNAFCDEDQAYQLRVNYYGIAAFALMAIMTVFALPCIRRTRFEWFYYTHHLFIFVLIFLCLHYEGAFIYLIPGVAMYMVDKLFPLFAYRSSGIVETRMVSPDVLEISIPTRTQGYYGGAYVFLNVPSVSWLEWHPFSLTSAPGNNDEKLVFHLKAAGSWTQAVIDAAQQAKRSGSDLTVRIDGFYGQRATERMTDKDAVVLVGGIGVTPMVSTARALVQEAPDVPVTLLWVVRTISEFGVLSNELECLRKKTGSNVDVRVWVTLSQPEPALESEMEEAGAKFLTKDELSDIPSLDDQTERALASLAAYQGQLTCKNDNKAASTYVFDRPGFDPASNALVMALSATVALSAFALSWHLGEVKEIQPNDKLAFVHMAMIVSWVGGFIGLVAAARSMFQKRKKTQTVLSKTAKSSRFSTGELTEVDESNVSAFGMHKTPENVQDTSSDGTPPSTGSESGVSNAGLADMIYGRIGQRPNMMEEFSKIETRNGTSGNRNVGVLACGPIAMVKSITSICNQPRGGCAWNFELEDGPDAFFSFTEEDWEW